MSLPFNQISSHSGIIQGIEDECGFNPGDISGNTFRMKKFTASVNRSIDSALVVIFSRNGKFRFDDSNHEKYNIIYADIVSGQRDYSFTEDEQGNLLLTFDKVFRKPSATGRYEEITPVDVVSENVNPSFYDGEDNQGVPMEYDKTANGFMFDVVPNYSVDEGIMIYVTREGSYFTTADTTKMPGFSGLFHRWCIVSPSLEYARINLPQNRINNLEREKLQLAKDMGDWYATRSKDEKPKFKGRKLNPLTGNWTRN